MTIIKAVTRLAAYPWRDLTLVQLLGLIEQRNSVNLCNPIMEITKGEKKNLPLLKSMTICNDAFSAKPSCLGLASREEL